MKTSGIGTRHGEDGIRKFCKKRAVLVARSYPSKDVQFYPTSTKVSPGLLKALQLVYCTAGRWRTAALRTRYASHDTRRAS